MNDFLKDQNLSSELITQDSTNEYLKYYNNFILQLKVIFPSNETNIILDNLMKMSVDNKLCNGLLFCNSMNDELFDLFVKKKIKLFSHKNPHTKTISESLFGSELCLKNILNNQEDNVKKVIWLNLYIVYLYAELLKPIEQQNKNKIELLNKLIYKDYTFPELNNTTPKTNNMSSESKQKLQEMLGVDVNEQTTTMIDDIVQSFEKVLTGQSTNPLSGIMDISQTISVKYADKINSGEIELDKLMKAITQKVPGMEEMMGGMLGTPTNKQEKEKIIIDENFSTANVEVGLNKEPEEKPFDISGMLKMANQFGVIPGGKDQEGSANGVPGLGKVFELMQKLDKTSTNEEAEALKGEMDSFLQNELGVDINQLNSQLDLVTKHLKTNDE
jgi:hypothetical protein